MGVPTGFVDRKNARIARVFFEAVTKASLDSEDILPQEGGPTADLSVFHVFSLLFPEIIAAPGARGLSFRRNTDNVLSMIFSRIFSMPKFHSCIASLTNTRPQDIDCPRLQLPLRSCTIWQGTTSECGSTSTKLGIRSMVRSRVAAYRLTEPNLVTQVTASD